MESQGSGHGHQRQLYKLSHLSWFSGSQHVVLTRLSYSKALQRCSRSTTQAPYQTRMQPGGKASLWRAKGLFWSLLPSLKHPSVPSGTWACTIHYCLQRPHCFS